MESYEPIRISTNDAGLYPWLIRRPVRECVTWALTIHEGFFVMSDTPCTHAHMHFVKTTILHTIYLNHVEKKTPIMVHADNNVC